MHILWIKLILNKIIHLWIDAASLKNTRTVTIKKNEYNDIQKTSITEQWQGDIPEPRESFRHCLVVDGFSMPLCSMPFIFKVMF